MTTSSSVPALRVRDLAVTFDSGAGPVKALRGITLDLSVGEFVTVIGSNGAGKSTLLKALTGAHVPNAGTIQLGRRDLTSVPEHRRARWIAQVSQETGSSVCGELDVLDNMLLALTRGCHRSPLRRARSRSRVRSAASALAAYGSGLSERLSQPAGMLSGGQRQFLALVMAVSVPPDLLLLDEHTSALDPQMAQTVMSATQEIVRARRLTTLMVTHNMNHAANYGDRLLIMSGGRIVDELDISTRAALGVEGLIERFQSVTSDGLTDRMLS